MKDILDREIEEKTVHPLLEFDLGAKIILGSILIETVLYFTSAYVYTCGYKIIDILISGVAGLISIYLYQKLKNKVKNYHWILIVICCLINLYLGILYQAVIC